MAAALTVISSMATRKLLAELLASLPGVPATVESVGGVDAARRVAAGEAFDAVVLGADAIDRLMAENGYKAVDVISLNADHPQKDALRQKFLNEHTHSEDEVRFFVAGSGLFILHVGDRVYEIECVKDDLIAVPDGATHWFDMGEYPNFVAIRFFTEPDGWVGHFTGTGISNRFPRYEPAAA